MTKSKKSGKKAKTNKPTVKEEKLQKNEVVPEEDIKETEEVVEDDSEEENEVIEEEVELSESDDEDDENSDDDDEDDEEDNDDEDTEDEDEEDDEEEDESDDDEDDDDDDESDDDDDDDEVEEKTSEKIEKREEQKVKEKEVKENKSEESKDLDSEAEKTEKKAGFFKTLFGKKYEEQESILTIFKDNKIYGAILGEVLGTMFITLVIFTLGMTQPLYMFVILLAIFAAVYKLSGAQLNPINTFGMMLTRRMSAIRGVLYLLAQVVGAWAGYAIVKTFIDASVGITGTETAQVPSMAAIADGYYWAIAFLEFFGAAIAGFFYVRAQEYKKNPLVFSGIVAGGMTIAIVVVYLLSYAYFGLSESFMLNPAVALMYGILPQSADGIGQLLAGIGQALFAYALFPMIGGAVGAYISDIAETFTKE